MTCCGDALPGYGVCPRHARVAAVGGMSVLPWAAHGGEGVRWSCWCADTVYAEAGDCPCCGCALIGVDGAGRVVAR